MSLEAIRCSMQVGLISIYQFVVIIGLVYMPVGSSKSVPSKLLKVCARQVSGRINITWEHLPCHLQNGASVTRHIIQYSHSEQETINITVPARQSTELTVTDSNNNVIIRMDCSTEFGSQHLIQCVSNPTIVIPGRVYIIQVAAVNMYGAGPFSDPIYVTVNTSKNYIFFIPKDVIGHVHLFISY